MHTAEYGGYCTDGDPQQLYQLVRNGVDYATAADLYVILDWHILSDGNPLQNADAAAEGGLPVFVTEFGICDASGNGQIDYESAEGLWLWDVLHGGTGA